MTFEEKKEEYASLIVKAGIHVRKGQRVFLRCTICDVEFGHLIMKKAYEEGASFVDIQWMDDIADRMTYEYAPLSEFETYPTWNADKLNTYAKTDVAFLAVVGSDPEALKGVDQKKLLARMKSSEEALKEYRKLQSTMSFKWNIVAVPTRPWAKKVFPGMTEDQAMEKLWNAIFGACRIGHGNAYEQWMEHARNLKEKCRKLNEWQFESLHYENSIGTDFTVGLVENYIFEGGADTDRVDGAPYFANMPTEECFTMPDNRKAEGVLVSALPLSYQGSLIENFRLTFKEGKVVDYEAEKGKDVLKLLLDTDEGSRRLGECALVPYPSPVAEQGILFLETLFDENAACHFALGACYETNLPGGENMSEEELHAHGGNTSINHVDFMVGTPDLKITGIRKNGEKIPVFENGTWAF